MRRFIKCVMLTFMGAVCGIASTLPVLAVTGVNPSGVNVSHSSPSTVFLTFQGLAAGQTAVEAFWCGAVTTTAVSAVDPCVPGTVFGRLPLRNSIGRASGTAGVRNFTDIMSIPASVTRRAYQDAQQGNDSRFFYVRRFANPTAYVVVTCRMAGGGARVPFSLVDVKLKFQTDRPVVVVPRGSLPPSVEAEIHYTGTGRLTGRWEVVSPGDKEPTAFDLLSEASLPVEDRGLQQRYTVLQRFDVFLPPTGVATIAGPDVEKIPHFSDGYYKLLFRVEATVDKESNSNAVAGVVAAGGSAGFPMPMLRYYVGSSGQVLNHEGKLELFSPKDSIPVRDSMRFTWLSMKSASYDRLEVVADGETVLSSIVKGGVGIYESPPWMRKQLNKVLKWRVISLDSKGVELSASEWVSFRIVDDEGVGK